MSNAPFASGGCWRRVRHYDDLDADQQGASAAAHRGARGHNHAARGRLRHRDVIFGSRSLCVRYLNGILDLRII